METIGLGIMMILCIFSVALLIVKKLTIAHKDIRIQFEVNGRRFEALGYLNKGEDAVSGYTILERVSDAIGEEDWAFLSEHLKELPAKLRRYYLVTARRDPSDPNRISCFRCNHWNNEWCKSSGDVDVLWYQQWNIYGPETHGSAGLVLRRYT